MRKFIACKFYDKESGHRGCELFDWVDLGVCKNIWSENPSIRSEISDIRSDFKISDISDRVSGKVFGTDTDRDFLKMATNLIRKPGDPIRKVRIFRIGFGSQFLRSEIFGYPNFWIGSGIRHWTPLGGPRFDWMAEGKKRPREERMWVEREYLVKLNWGWWESKDARWKSRKFGGNGVKKGEWE